MLLTCVLVFILYIFTRNCFVDLIIFVPALLYYMHDVSKNANSRKWIYIWIYLATLSIFLKPLSHISQFNYVKLATSYYFLFFDKENYLEMAISSDSQKNEKPEAKNRMTVLLTNTLNYCKNEPFTARK